MKAPTWIKQTIGVLLVLLAAISLFLAQSSYWVNHTIFNKENFSAIASQAVLEPSSRDAIASTVVDQALGDRPIIKRVIGDKAEKLISSLLDSDFSTQAVSSVVGATYKYITTPDRQDIALELSAIKTPITRILSLVQADDSNLAVTIESIPDQVVLVESDSFPNLSNFVSVMLWIGPLFWLASLVLFIIYIYINRQKYVRAVYVVAGSISVVALIGIFTRPITPPPIASLVPLSNLRPVVQNISDAFLAPFQTQMIIMLVIVLVATVIFALRKVIARQTQKLASFILARTSEKKSAVKTKNK